MFKDANSREWQVKLDAPKISEVRKECGIDLAALDGNTFDRLNNDPVVLVNVLWVLVRGQNSGTTDVQFGESLVGDPIDSATEALLSAITDFFPSRKRSLLRSLTDKQTAVSQKAMELAMAKINDPALEANLLAAMEERLTKDLENLLTGLRNATDSPATAESAQKD